MLYQHNDQLCCNKYSLLSSSALTGQRRGWQLRTGGDLQTGKLDDNMARIFIFLFMTTPHCIFMAHGHGHSEMPNMTSKEKLMQVWSKPPAEPATVTVRKSSSSSPRCRCFQCLLCGRKFSTVRGLGIHFSWCTDMDKKWRKRKVKAMKWGLIKDHCRCGL